MPEARLIHRMCAQMAKYGIRGWPIHLYHVNWSSNLIPFLAHSCSLSTAECKSMRMKVGWTTYLEFSGICFIFKFFWSSSAAAVWERAAKEQPSVLFLILGLIRWDGDTGADETRSTSTCFSPFLGGKKKKVENFFFCFSFFFVSREKVLSENRFAPVFLGT